MLLLIVLIAALACAVSGAGSASDFTWNAAALAIGLAGAVYWLFARRSGQAPPLRPALRWLLLLLPAYAVFQIVPLPVAALRLLSPARAELLRASAAVLPDARFAPLSVVPAATLQHAVRIAVCVLLLLLVREVGWRFSERSWRLAGPLIGIAALEAVLGVAQYWSGAAADGANGTYYNRNHFAGFLEMALPFAALYPVVLLRRAGGLSLRAAVAACAGMAAAAAILLGVVLSLSRMGFIAALSAMFVAISGAGRGAGRRPVLVALAAVACVLLFLFLPNLQFIARFGDMGFSDGITSQDRVELWKETLPLVAAYPLFGCGLGGYESAFMKYKIIGPTLADNFAHNDYLQYLAEFGVIGVAMAAAVLLALVAGGLRAVARSGFEERALVLACAAAVLAILIHSAVDFNLYMPPNCLMLSWILGICAASPFWKAAAGRESRRARLQVEWEPADSALFPVSRPSRDAKPSTIVGAKD